MALCKLSCLQPCSMWQTGVCRRAAESAPCVLVVRDLQQHVFGSFTSESWRVAPRYYGTGESFVFQIQVCPQAASPMHVARVVFESLSSPKSCIMLHS